MGIKPSAGAGSVGPVGPAAGTFQALTPLAINGDNASHATSGALIATFAPLTDPVFYVDPAAGNDSNDGSIGSPFLTINKALASLNPGHMGWAQINLRAGVNTIGNRTVFPRSLGNTNATAGGLLINGVDNTDSGLGARTANGGTSGNQATFGTVVDTVGGLVVNAWRGFFLRFTSGANNGRSFLIENNTATTFTIQGSITTAPTTETFVVESPAASIAWPGTEVFQGQGTLLGLQNVILNGPGGANFLFLNEITLGLQRVQMTNLGSFGITIGEHSSLLNLTAVSSQLGGLSITQQCGTYFNFNATISPLSTARMSVTRCLFQDVRVDLQQLSLFQALDSTFRGNAWIRSIFGGDVALDRFHMDTVTPAPTSTAFQGAAGAAIVLSKGATGNILHGDISNTPATTGPGDAILVEDQSRFQIAAVTGTGNAGVGCRMNRMAQGRVSGVNTVSGPAGQEIKVGANAVTTWANVVAAINTDPVELCIAGP